MPVVLEQPAPPAGGGRVEWGTYGPAEAGRRWRLYVPVSRPAGRAAPLLVFLHGCTQDVEDLARGTRMDDEAERGGFLVLYPEQPAKANGLKCWNWFDPAHQRGDAGEPRLLADLVARVAGSEHVDAGRVHVAGISAGAAMALIVGAAYPDRFASVTAASGVPLGAVRDATQAWQVMRSGPAVAPDGDAVRALMGARARALPLLVIHGGADATVAPANGRAVAAQWADAVGATEASDEEAVPERDDAHAYARRSWHSPAGEALVELIEIAGLGHSWSGGSTAGTYTDARGPSASRLVADFVARHSRGRTGT